ncbi:MAG: hypothetical protein Q9162_001613 [Coniocarpon cinnabarinum]
MHHNNLNVLICGGGVSAHVAAFWLAEAGATVTIVEKEPGPPKHGGQCADIRGPAIMVMEGMGIEEPIKACRTKEVGLQKIGTDGSVLATFDASHDEKAQGFTSEYEVRRSDLARILQDTIQDDVKLVYDEWIKDIDEDTSVEEDKRQVKVSFANGLPDASYDLVIGADGMASHTRSLVTGRPKRDDTRGLGGYCAYFSMPRGPTDSMDHSRFYNADHGRSILLRPISESEMSVCIALTGHHDPRLQDAADNGPVQRQKALMEEYFELSDAGWESHRILEAMKLSEDFSFQEIAQVHMRTSWSWDKIVFVGDAAYAPSPVTGMATSAAIYGAYVLAGEIGNHPGDIPAALHSYENIMRPYVEDIQQLPYGAVAMANPQTSWGVHVLNAVAATVSTLRLQRLGGYMPHLTKGEDKIPPAYNWAPAHAELTTLNGILSTFKDQVAHRPGAQVGSGGPAAVKPKLEQPAQTSEGKDFAPQPSTPAAQTSPQPSSSQTPRSPAPQPSPRCAEQATSPVQNSAPAPAQALAPPAAADKA